MTMSMKLSLECSKKKLFKIRTEDNEKQLKRKFEQFFKKVVRASSKLTIKL